MLTRLVGALLCRDPRCDCWPLPDLSGEAARGMASLRVDAALLDGEPVVRGAAARSFGNSALGDRGIPSRSWRPEIFSERAWTDLATNGGPKNFWSDSFVAAHHSVSV